MARVARLGPNFDNDDYDASIGNSNYNSLQASLRHTSRTLDVMIAYTFSKSIDQSSSLAEPLYPFNFGVTRALSAWDLTHNLVATYQYQLPLERLFKHSKGLTQGWTISGITRISSGFPVTLHADGDNSLTGSIPNGVNNHSPICRIITALLSTSTATRATACHISMSRPSADNALGTPGNASRRSFYGPGALNFDLALLKNLRSEGNQTAAIPPGNIQYVQSCAVLRTRRRRWWNRYQSLWPGGAGRTAAADATRDEIHVLTGFTIKSDHAAASLHPRSDLDGRGPSRRALRAAFFRGRGRPATGASAVARSRRDCPAPIASSDRATTITASRPTTRSWSAISRPRS